MGTSNFYNKNANQVYACLMGDVEEFEILNFKLDVSDMISELPYEFYEEDTYDNNRSFCGHYLCRIESSKIIGNVELIVSLKVVLRSGYYDGANLDWEIECDNTEYNCISDYIEDAFDYSEMNAGLKVIHKSKATDWIEEIQEKMINDVEKVFAKITQPLKVVARFSNGETIYEKTN